MNSSPLPSVTMDPRCHLPSTWRDAIGAVLTNRKINEYARLGYYGQQKAEKASKAFAATHASHPGIVYRCDCGRLSGVRYLRYSYLPRAGYWCRICVSQYQKQRDLEDSLKNKWKEAAKLEYC